MELVVFVAVVVGVGYVVYHYRDKIMAYFSAY